jgi:arabinose-5-phosphate isomerase
VQDIDKIALPNSRDVARRVLQIEGNALLALGDDLPADFAAAVDLILNTPGRLVVSGIGKSGHIGRKIAATFASTGAPSFFVHPAEASHGDLGMITPQDICLIISNSGETSELGDIIAHCGRISVSIIGISSHADSTMMRAARLRLTLPDLPEACSIGMAPTTSTTLTLAMGDALAIALMELRGFKREHFHSYHPGGKLGAQLLNVAQLMHAGEAVPCVPEAMAIPEAIEEMSARGFGIVGLVDGQGRLVGVITDGDLRRNLHRLMEPAATAVTVATRNPAVVSPDTLAVEALAQMNARKVGAVFVTDANRLPIGILHIHDCLRAGVL